MNGMNLILYADTSFNDWLNEEYFNLSEEDQELMMQEIANREMASVEKITNMLKFIKNVESFQESCKAEENRIKENRIKAEKAIDRLKESIKTYMEKKDMESINAGTFNLKLANCPDSVEITDIEAIPEKYIRIKKEADKTSIKKFLQGGFQLPGCQLITGKKSLRIK